MSSSDDSDGCMEVPSKKPTASRKAVAKGKSTAETRVPLPSTARRRLPSADSDNSDDDSSADELEVLPPKMQKMSNKISRSRRLSYSGMDQDDPVTLLQSDDELEDRKMPSNAARKNSGDDSVSNNLVSKQRSVPASILSTTIAPKRPRPKSSPAWSSSTSSTPVALRDNSIMLEEPMPLPRKSADSDDDDIFEVAASLPSKKPKGNSSQLDRAKNTHLPQQGQGAVAGSSSHRAVASKLPKYDDTTTSSSDSEKEGVTMRSSMMAIPKAYQTSTKTARLSHSNSTEPVDLLSNDESDKSEFGAPPLSQASSSSATQVGKSNGSSNSNKLGGRRWSDDDDSDASSDNSLAALSSKLVNFKKRKAATANATATAAAPTKSTSTVASRRQNEQTTAASQKGTTKSKVNAEKKAELAQLKEAQKLAKQEERLRLRQEKEDAKAAAALAKEQKKEAQQADKRAKERQKIDDAQVSGKLAKEEIAVLLQTEQFPPTQYSLIADLQVKYLVQDHASALQCNAVQWIRLDKSLGGAAAAVQQLHSRRRNGGGAAASKHDGAHDVSKGTSFHHFPVVVIVVSDAARFLKLLERPDRSDSGSSHGANGSFIVSDEFDDDDYPALEQWLKGIECGWRAAWSIPSSRRQSADGGMPAMDEVAATKPRLILLLDRVLETLDKQWIQYRKAAASRSNGAAAPPTAEDVHDAITWILIQFQVECVHCTCPEDISTHLLKMTRLLAEIPYRKTVTEIECIQKLRPECFETDPPDVQAKDCWMRQLQQVPRLSRPMAEHLVHYYPNAQSLYTQYTNPRLTLDEKLSLTANLMSARTTHNKVSAQLYTALTSTDPNEVLR